MNQEELYDKIQKASDRIYPKATQLIREAQPDIHYFPKTPFIVLGLSKIADCPNFSLDRLDNQITLEGMTYKGPREALEQAIHFQLAIALMNLYSPADVLFYVTLEVPLDSYDNTRIESAKLFSRLGNAGQYVYELSQKKFKRPLTKLPIIHLRYAATFRDEWNSQYIQVKPMKVED